MAQPAPPEPTSPKLRREMVFLEHSGFHWGSDFIGFVVATFFTIVFFGIIGAIVGAVGYQLNAHVPKPGQPIGATAQQLGIGGLIGGLIALFLAYLIGGYVAGRMARFDGPKQGVGVVIWTVIVSIVLGLLGWALGNRFNLAAQLHLNISRTDLTTAGLISLVVTLVVILVAAIIGAIMGVDYNRNIDRQLAG